MHHVVFVKGIAPTGNVCKKIIGNDATGRLANARPKERLAPIQLAIVVLIGHAVIVSMDAAHAIAVQAPTQNIGNTFIDTRPRATAALGCFDVKQARAFIDR